MLHSGFLPPQIRAVNEDVVAASIANASVINLPRAISNVFMNLGPECATLALRKYIELREKLHMVMFQMLSILMKNSVF